MIETEGSIRFVFHLKFLRQAMREMRLSVNQPFASTLQCVQCVNNAIRKYYTRQLAIFSASN